MKKFLNTMGESAENELRMGVTSFLARHCAGVPESARIQFHAIRNGLECIGLFRVRTEFLNRKRRPCRMSFAIKHIGVHNMRELSAYRLLLEPRSVHTPRLLNAEYASGGGARLYLEWIERSCTWPWRDERMIGLALGQLAKIHESLSSKWFIFPHRLSYWDYEKDLFASARETLQLFEAMSPANDPAKIRHNLPNLRRVVNRLPLLRNQLLNAGKPVVLHGDLHSGNVIVRAHGGLRQAIFLDWSRTRLGSEMEDISSWLQSLAYWEPVARRYHDNFLKVYLRSRGLSDGLGSSLRELYWIAAASNGLSGAIRYHLSIMSSPHLPTKLSQSVSALQNWMRIIRRVDAITRS